MNDVLIRCQVSPGLFDSEYFVSVNGRSAYYVNRANVQVNPQPTAEQAVDGKVRGYKVDTRLTSATIRHWFNSPAKRLLVVYEPGLRMTRYSPLLRK